MVIDTIYAFKPFTAFRVYFPTILALCPLVIAVKPDFIMLYHLQASQTPATKLWVILMFQNAKIWGLWAPNAEIWAFMGSKNRAFIAFEMGNVFEFHTDYQTGIKQDFFYLT